MAAGRAARICFVSALCPVCVQLRGASRGSDAHTPNHIFTLQIMPKQFSWPQTQTSGIFIVILDGQKRRRRIQRQEYKNTKTREVKLMDGNREKVVMLYFFVFARHNV